MKRKKINWEHVPWTPFEILPADESKYPPGGAPAFCFANSRYQGAMWFGEVAEWGGVKMIHVSFKTNDNRAYHDWRDIQRIKNELCGDDSEGVELYPAETRLVDTCNQYHLFCFAPGFKLPFGFKERLVCNEDGKDGSRQRRFPADATPKDLVPTEVMEEMLRKARAGE